MVDAFVVDLQQVTLLCSFTADAEYSRLAVVYDRTGWSAAIHDSMADSLGYRIIEHLQKLTGGTIGEPK